jgi:hypothetical protein
MMLHKFHKNWPSVAHDYLFYSGFYTMCHWNITTPPPLPQLCVIIYECSLSVKAFVCCHQIHYCFKMPCIGDLGSFKKYLTWLVLGCSFWCLIKGYPFSSPAGPRITYSKHLKAEPCSAFEFNLIPVPTIR